MSKHGVGERASALARKEVGLVLAGLSADADRDEAVHAARKAIRRLRALLALLDDSDLDVSRADRSLQRLGDSLSDMRDAHVVTDTAQRLQRDHPDVDWRPVLAAMQARSGRIMRKYMAADPDHARRRAQVDRVADGLAQQPWQTLKPGILKSGVQRSERRARKAGKRAARNDDPESIHRWRRRIRRLRMQLEALEELGIPSCSSGKEHAGSTKALHKLSDRLGWQQDLRMLRNLVRPMSVWDGKAAVLETLDAELQDAGVDAALEV